MVPKSNNIFRILIFLWCWTIRNFFSLRLFYGLFRYENSKKILKKTLRKNHLSVDANNFSRWRLMWSGYRCSISPATRTWHLNHAIDHAFSITRKIPLKTTHRPTPPSARKDLVQARAAETITELTKNDSTRLQICVGILRSGDAPVPSANKNS